MAKIVLASKSPRRQELLKNIGITEFDIRVPEADESYPEHFTPAQIVEHISRQKAIAAAAICTEEEIVITADTMVFLDDKRLGKPKDEADAKRMLKTLCGKTHTVLTGVCLIKETGESLVSVTETKVTFNAYNEKVIDRYVATKSPLDKAGAYGIQDEALAPLVNKVDGNLDNVIGFPVQTVENMIQSFF